jgi:hypothetical protein
VADIRNAIAAHIRAVDGNNQLGPYELATSIGQFLHEQGVVGDVAVKHAVEDFAYEANRGASGYLQPKRLGAEALADAIVDHFHLEEN